MNNASGDSIASNVPLGRRRRAWRRLAAILATAILAIDVRGYSTMMADDEEDTHRRVMAEIDRLTREVEKSYRAVFSSAGDGLVAEFPSAVEALKCALRI